MSSEWKDVSGEWNDYAHLVALDKRRMERELQQKGMSRKEAMKEVSRIYSHEKARGRYNEVRTAPQPQPRRSNMSWALWVVGMLALILAIAARFAFIAADRPGDDFGAGMLFWALLFLTGIFGVCWLCLAAIHWAPRL